jgi:hypothetical protein
MQVQRMVHYGNGFHFSHLVLEGGVRGVLAQPAEKIILDH